MLVQADGVNLGRLAGGLNSFPFGSGSLCLRLHGTVNLVASGYHGYHDGAKNGNIALHETLIPVLF